MALSLLCTFVAHITFLHVFFLPPPFIISLSLAFSFSLSLFLSLSLSLPPLSLSLVARHMSSDALYQIFSSWSILLFHIISFHSSYKIHQLFTDYLLRLPSSELLEKHLFRSRANRRLVWRCAEPFGCLNHWLLPALFNFLFNSQVNWYDLHSENVPSKWHGKWTPLARPQSMVWLQRNGPSLNGKRCHMTSSLNQLFHGPTDGLNDWRLW